MQHSFPLLLINVFKFTLKNKKEALTKMGKKGLIL